MYAFYTVQLTFYREIHPLADWEMFIIYWKATEFALRKSKNNEIISLLVNRYTKVFIQMTS